MNNPIMDDILDTLNTYMDYINEENIVEWMNNHPNCEVKGDIHTKFTTWTPRNKGESELYFEKDQSVLKPKLTKISTYNVKPNDITIDFIDCQGEWYLRHDDYDNKVDVKYCERFGEEVGSMDYYHCVQGYSEKDFLKGFKKHITQKVKEKLKKDIETLINKL